jgi:hypothetical protein
LAQFAALLALAGKAAAIIPNKIKNPPVIHFINKENLATFLYVFAPKKAITAKTIANPKPIKSYDK